MSLKTLQNGETAPITILVSNGVSHEVSNGVRHGASHEVSKKKEKKGCYFVSFWRGNFFCTKRLPASGLKT